MRNIVEFKAFKDCGHEYYDIINDTKCYYNLFYQMTTRRVLVI